LGFIGLYWALLGCMYYHKLKSGEAFTIVLKWPRVTGIALGQQQARELAELHLQAP
jgi:hypothetical protein